MTISRLDTPLRVTWELHGALSAMAPAAALTVAERLAEAGLFYVTLVNRPLAHPQFSEILKILKVAGIQVQATFSGSDDEWSGGEGLASLPSICVDASAFLVTGADADWEALFQTLERLSRWSVQPALQLVPDRDRLPLLPQLFSFCRRYGVTRIKLPNTPVNASFSRLDTESLPTIEQLQRLREELTDLTAMRAGLTLEVHDLFLWEILFPGEREDGRAEYGGCQAANSLAHVDSRGVVHPCSSWPQELGSLLERSLEEIWQDQGRFVILEKIATRPVGCVGCVDYDGRCFGGCRGLVEVLGLSKDGCDLLCPGRRTTL